MTRHFALSPDAFMVFALAATVGAYLLGVAMQRRLGSPIANPVLVAIVLLGAILRLLHIPYATYFAGARLIHFLLGPATVALAVPLVRSLEHMRRSLGPMMCALLAGSLVGLASGYGLVRLCGGNRLVALAMAPKSLTTPIAIGIAQTLGADTSLAAVLAIAGGILVAAGMDPVLGWLRIDDYAVRGLAAGTAGSGIGASRVIPQHPVAAAFAAVAIGLNGVFTAILAPLVLPLLKFW